MFDSTSGEYHRRRERQERDLALSSRDALIKAIHTQMADQHAVLAGKCQIAG